MILVSADVLERSDASIPGVHVLPDTYTAFGNDGAHFNQAINSGTNSVVSAPMADALHAASDHLPLYADFVIYADETTPVESTPELPAGYALYQNYPNPFNPTTRISFTLPVASRVTLTVYTLIGERIAVLLDEYRASGEHSVVFDASRISAGIYWYKMQTDDFQDVKRFVLIK